MWQQLLPAIRITLALTILTGLIYPAVITGICQVAFSHAANGSLVERDGKVAGSELIGQRFTKPEYFHPRPSAAGNDGYDAASSGGSNLGPTSQKLVDRVKADAAKFRQENPAFLGALPADAVTASASGLDPDISPATALAQAPRVAQARRVPVGDVEALIAKSTTGRTLGILGEPSVNVLKLNLALDQELKR